MRLKLKQNDEYIITHVPWGFLGYESGSCFHFTEILTSGYMHVLQMNRVNLRKINKIKLQYLYYKAEKRKHFNNYAPSKQSIMACLINKNVYVFFFYCICRNILMYLLVVSAKSCAPNNGL